jgi:hypothetical protein
MGKGMIRVDRGDGRLLQFQPNDVEAFLKATPGAKKVDGPSASVSVTPAEAAATKAQEAKDGLDGKTIAQLKDYADEKGIDLSGASVKADIIERIEAAEKAAETPSE